MRSTRSRGPSPGTSSPTTTASSGSTGASVARATSTRAPGAPRRRRRSPSTSPARPGCAARPATACCARLPEREDVGLGPGGQEADLERPFADGLLLAHELVQAALAEQPVAVAVDVEAVRAAGGLTVEEDAERDRRLPLRREHEVGVAGMEAERDAAPGVVEGDTLAPDGPPAGQGPLVEAQGPRRR